MKHIVAARGCDCGDDICWVDGGVVELLKRSMSRGYEDGLEQPDTGIVHVSGISSEWIFLYSRVRYLRNFKVFFYEIETITSNPIVLPSLIR